MIREQNRRGVHGWWGKKRKEKRKGKEKKISYVSGGEKKERKKKKEEKREGEYPTATEREENRIGKEGILGVVNKIKK